MKISVVTKLAAFLQALGFMKGLVGGMAIVMSVHSINGLLGYASLACPSFSPLFQADPVLLLKSFVNMLLQGVRGIITAAGIALAEELLFRSWLLEEVAVDLGYYRAIVISGIAFSLIHGYALIGCVFKLPDGEARRALGKPKSMIKRWHYLSWITGTTPSTGGGKSQGAIGMSTPGDRHHSIGTVPTGFHPGWLMKPQAH
ncbi:hypothetical protein B296_00004526 [Ensete ventricosum]|uniref:CAAX prenyl protease 2/Lysostaphin resistance protein A-like domain-containing protein n=1 Tax=Ensete ventricosum TaxID=4639 RepID=A0A427B3J6_ENSVE|nr:hypothetical protein B296_00004526 [Ensete ventricosum]